MQIARSWPDGSVQIQGISLWGIIAGCKAISKHRRFIHLLIWPVAMLWAFGEWSWQCNVAEGSFTLSCVFFSHSFTRSLSLISSSVSQSKQMNNCTKMAMAILYLLDSGSERRAGMRTENGSVLGRPGGQKCLESSSSFPYKESRSRGTQRRPFPKGNKYINK